MSNRQLAAQYGINESNIRTWKKRASELKDGKAMVRKEGSGRKPISGEMEEKLMSWISEMVEKNLMVTVKGACN